jgi:hypothetical protein
MTRIISCELRILSLTNGNKTNAIGSISVDNASTTFSPIATSDLIIDPIDRGQFMVADNNPLPSTCNLPAGTINNNGAIVVDVTGANGTGNPPLVKILGASAPGTPSNSYGYIRFTTKVDR